MKTTVTPATQTMSLSENARAELKRREAESWKLFPHFMEAWESQQCYDTPAELKELFETEPVKSEGEQYYKWRASLPPLPD